MNRQIHERFLARARLDLRPDCRDWPQSLLPMPAATAASETTRRRQLTGPQDGLGSTAR